jgi:hypothetical protein
LGIFVPIFYGYYILPRLLPFIENKNRGGTLFVIFDERRIQLEFFPGSGKRLNSLPCQCEKSD